MSTSDAGGPIRARRQWAGNIIVAGGITTALAAYYRAGRGHKGLAAAYQALEESFPEANARSLAVAVRHMREGIDAMKRKRTQRPETARKYIPDARPLIRGAKRER